MSEWGLQLADGFFMVFHTALVLFNILGWVLKKTRLLHLVTLVATLASWGILGIWYGWGYCFLTDWHYRVLRQLGETDLPESYISYLVYRLSGWLPPGNLVNGLTLSVTLLVVVISVCLQIKGRR